MATPSRAPPRAPGGPADRSATVGTPPRRRQLTRPTPDFTKSRARGRPGPRESGATRTWSCGRLGQVHQQGTTRTWARGPNDQVPHGGRRGPEGGGETTKSASRGWPGPGPPCLLAKYTRGGTRTSRAARAFKPVANGTTDPSTTQRWIQTARRPSEMAQRPKKNRSGRFAAGK